jgi:hypothetical protein
MSAIAKIYAKRVKAGEIAIEDVPERIRGEVEEILSSN